MLDDQLIEWLETLLSAMEDVEEGAPPEVYEELVCFLYNEVDGKLKELKDE